MPRILTCCPHTPSLGTKSRFCADHQYLEKSDDQPSVSKLPRIVITINSREMTASTRVLDCSKDLPDSDDRTVHIGCKKATNVDRFYDRTAGVMALVRPCGIIVDATEMFTCESPTQLFIQLLRLKCDSGVDVSYLGYDRACEFEPFLNNLAAKLNPGAELLLKDTKFLVDKFHIKGHTTPQCQLDSPLCKYHPDLPRFNTIGTTNTECAEQCFAWLGKFKGMCKYMSHYKFLLFLKLIILAKNTQTEKRCCR